MSYTWSYDTTTIPASRWLCVDGTRTSICVRQRLRQPRGQEIFEIWNGETNLGFDALPLAEARALAIQWYETHGRAGTNR